MHQLRDEPFRTFAARVRGKAVTCAFTIDCTCGLKINYTDHMIWDTLLNGIADDEIRRKILGSADMLTRAVNEIVALVEAKEMARNAVPPTEVTSVSAVQRLHDQTTEHVVMQPHAGNSTIYLIGQNSRVVLLFIYLFIYLFSFFLTINLKLIIVHVEIKIVNKEAATKRSTLYGRRTFEQNDVMLIRKGKRKDDN